MNRDQVAEGTLFANKEFAWALFALVEAVRSNSSLRLHLKYTAVYNDLSLPVEDCQANSAGLFIVP